MELTPKIMEAEKSHDLPSANWTPRKATGVIQYKSEIMRIKGVSVNSNPRAGEDRYPSSSRQGGKGSLLPCSFFLNFIYLFTFIFGCAGSSLLLFSCGEQGLLSSCSSKASHCGGFSCHGAWALGCSGFSSFGMWTQ